MTSPSTPPSHICPHCKLAQHAEAFTNAQGETRRWCVTCREEHRQAIISRRAKKLDGRAEELAEVARREGYRDSKLANILALAHLAGEKRALAIRGGRSWMGQKAWREYYKAKRELAKMMEETK